MAIITTDNTGSLVDRLISYIVGTPNLHVTGPIYNFTPNFIDQETFYFAYTVASSAQKISDGLNGLDVDGLNLDSVDNSLIHSTLIDNETYGVYKHVVAIKGTDLSHPNDAMWTSFTDKLNYYGTAYDPVTNPYTTSKDNAVSLTTSDILFYPNHPEYGLTLKSLTSSEIDNTYSDFSNPNPTEKSTSKYNFNLKGEFHVGIINFDSSETHQVYGTFNSYSTNRTVDDYYQAMVFGTGFKGNVSFSIQSKNGIDVLNSFLDGTVDSLKYSNIGTNYFSHSGSGSTPSITSTPVNETYISTAENSFLTIELNKYVSLDADASTEGIAAALLFGNDNIKSTNDINYLNGYGGNDSIQAYAGNDTIFGGSGRDTIKAGDGIDVIYGDAGADKLYGGKGADLFIFNSTDSGVVLSSLDRVMDFVSGVDKLDFGLAAGSESNYSESTITSKNFNAAYLAANNVIDGDVIYSFQHDKFNGYLFADTNKDGIADTSIILQGLSSADKFTFTDISNFI